MPRLGRGPRSAAAALGLVACSALLIHFWDGQIEGHFHFFVVVSLLILYQDWLPFLIAVGFVVLHHGVLGSVMPHTVYSSEIAAAHPWSWAFIHGAFILAASAANVVSWRATEQLLRDPLTGLAGRAIMLDRLRLGLRRAHRRALHAGVIFLDLDRFKVLNDSLGHAAGDRVLITASERLRDAVRANDTAVRFGGDEFVIVCEDLRDSDEAVGVAERLIAALREPYVVDGHEIVLTVSAGIAVGGRDDDRSAEDLIRDADAAMYRAKENGKDRYVVFGEEMRARALTRLADELDLRYALRRGELHVRYEPQFALGSGRVRALEARVHWQHPTRGLLGAARLHGDRRGDRHGRPDRRMGDRRGLPPARRLAPGGRDAGPRRVDQRLRLPAARHRLRRDGRGTRCAPATSSRRRCAWRSPRRRSWPTRARP